MLEGLHNDTDKARWDLLMWKAVGGVVDVLTYGTRKYDERNWEQGIKFSRLFASAMRHMLKWWLREDIDLESGLHHLKHAACNILMILDYHERGLSEFDNRPQAIHSGATDNANDSIGGRLDKTAGEKPAPVVPRYDHLMPKPQCAHRGFRYYQFDGKTRIGPFCDDCRQEI